MRTGFTLTLLFALALSASLPAQEHCTAEPPIQLVRAVVYNELHDHQRHGYWHYWIDRHTAHSSERELQVETADGPVKRLTLFNGQSLDSAHESEEQQRLAHLLHSPDEQSRLRHAYAEDEARIGRIVALLPDAFLYTPIGCEGALYRLHFQPNPAYPAHSIEARIFHAMHGELAIDLHAKRLARLEGHLAENVDFGYGILGRLNKDGWFLLARTPVSSTDWKTEQLEIHMNGRALLLKSFARETSERRGGFTPAPAGMNLTQGVYLLEELTQKGRPYTQTASLRNR